MRALATHRAHTDAAFEIDHRTDARHVLRHVFEMTAAMLRGMALLGVVFR